MTQTFYSRRAGVPKQCPTCGDKPYIPKDMTMGELFKACYSGWHVRLESRRPFWNVPGWYGVCSSCIFRRLLSDTKPNLLKREKGWDGAATVEIPRHLP